MFIKNLVRKLVVISCLLVLVCTSIMPVQAAQTTEIVNGGIADLQINGLTIPGEMLAKPEIAGNLELVAARLGNSFPTDLSDEEQTLLINALYQKATTQFADKYGEMSSENLEAALSAPIEPKSLDQFDENYFRTLLANADNKSGDPDKTLLGGWGRLCPVTVTVYDQYGNATSHTYYVKCWKVVVAVIIIVVIIVGSSL